MWVKLRACNNRITPTSVRGISVLGHFGPFLKDQIEQGPN